MIEPLLRLVLCQHYVTSTILVNNFEIAVIMKTNDLSIFIALFYSRCCSCCCSKSAGMDVEVASDDEKGQMLQNEDQGAALDDSHNAPLHPTGDDNM